MQLLKLLQNYCLIACNLGKLHAITEINEDYYFPAEMIAIIKKGQFYFIIPSKGT